MGNGRKKRRGGEEEEEEEETKLKTVMHTDCSGGGRERRQRWRSKSVASQAREKGGS